MFYYNRLRWLICCILKLLYIEDYFLTSFNFNARHYWKNPSESSPDFRFSGRSELRDFTEIRVSADNQSIALPSQNHNQRTNEHVSSADKSPRSSTVTGLMVELALWSTKVEIRTRDIALDDEHSYDGTNHSKASTFWSLKDGKLWPSECSFYEKRPV